MGRVILAAGAAFALFLLFGTGFGVIRARQAQATARPAASAVAATAVDTAENGLVVDSPPAPVGEPAEVNAVEPTEAERREGPARADSAPPLQALPMPAGSSRNTADAVDHGLQLDELRQGRVAKLFSAMAPRDAAKVFEHMSDHDVITVLGRLPERRAGEILAVMAAPRSASLTRSMLLSTPPRLP